MREIFFHEDEYGTIELLPETNWDFCQHEAARIDDFSKRHRAEIGWTDMYLRSGSRHPISELAIPTAALQSAVAPRHRPFDCVFTGWSAHSEPAPHTQAFGTNDAVVLFVESAADATVSTAWLEFMPTTPKDRHDALHLLETLAAWPLLLADWGWTTIIRLSDTSTLTRYLDKRVEVFSQPHPWQ